MTDYRELTLKDKRDLSQWHKCEACGQLVTEVELVFIETDWGLCRECAKDVADDVEQEMSAPL